MLGKSYKSWLLVVGLVVGMVGSHSVVAFGGGGGGHGRRSTTANAGVDAIGAHYNGSTEGCPDGLMKSWDGSCAVCKNGNLFLSYNRGQDCETEVAMNQDTCESDADCPNGGCCDEVTHMCQAGFYDKTRTYICPATESKACRSNNDCQQGEEFCNIIATNYDEVLVPDWVCDVAHADCSQGERSTYVLATAIGTCTPIGVYTESKANSKLTQLLGKTRKSDFDLSWWAAENWCKAQGMRLLDVRQLACYQGPEESQLIQEGSDVIWATCCQKYTNQCSAYSPVILAFDEAFGRGRLWTASYMKNYDLIHVFTVEPHEGLVFSLWRDSSQTSAVCVE